MKNALSRTRGAVAVLLLVGSLLAVVPGWSATRQEQRRYASGAVLAGNQTPGRLIMDGHCGGRELPQGACFALEGSESQVFLAIADDHYSGDLSAQAYFKVDGNWWPADHGLRFCGSGGTLGIPSEADFMYIEISQFLWDFSNCSTPSLPTTGTIFAAFD